MDAFNAAAEIEISPWDALLVAVRRRAARVRWVDSVIEEMVTQHKKEMEHEGIDNPLPPDGVRVWMEESRREERMFTRSAKMAVDAGVADAVVRRLELEGRLVTDALVAGLDVLPLTPEQRLRALTTMHNVLSGEPNKIMQVELPNIDVSRDIQDAEVEENPPEETA
jgi:hypothetical protein